MKSAYKELLEALDTQAEEEEEDRGLPTNIEEAREELLDDTDMVNHLLLVSNIHAITDILFERGLITQEEYDNRVQSAFSTIVDNLAQQLVDLNNESEELDNEATN